MSNPSGSRPAGSAVLFTNGDTSYESFRDLGAERVGECVMLKCLSSPQVTDAAETYPRTRARLESEMGLCVAMESVEGSSLNTLLAVAQARERDFAEAFRLDVGAAAAAALTCAHACSDDAGFALGIVNRVQTEPGAGPRRRTLTKPPTA